MLLAIVGVNGRLLRSSESAVGSGDFVRLGLEATLKHNLRVIRVLIDDAQVPALPTCRQA